MSVLMTNAQREKRAAAEAAVVHGLEEELAGAARELGVRPKRPTHTHTWWRSTVAT